MFLPTALEADKPSSATEIDAPTEQAVPTCQELLAKIAAIDVELERDIPSVREIIHSTEASLSMGSELETNLVQRLFHQALYQSSFEAFEFFMSSPHSLKESSFALMFELIKKLKTARARSQASDLEQVLIDARLDVFSVLREKLVSIEKDLNADELRILSEAFLDTLHSFYSETLLSVVDRREILEEELALAYFVHSVEKEDFKAFDILHALIYDLEIRGEGATPDIADELARHIALIKLMRENLRSEDSDGDALGNALRHVFASDVSNELRLAAILEAERILNEGLILYSAFFVGYRDQAQDLRDQIQTEPGMKMLADSLNQLIARLDAVIVEFRLIAEIYALNGMGFDLNLGDIVSEDTRRQILWSIFRLAEEPVYSREMTRLIDLIARDRIQELGLISQYGSLISWIKRQRDQTFDEEAIAQLDETLERIYGVLPQIYSFKIAKQVRSQIKDRHHRTRESIRNIIEWSPEELARYRSRYLLSTQQTNALLKALEDYDKNTESSSRSADVRGIDRDRVTLSSENASLRVNWFVGHISLTALKPRDLDDPQYEMERRRYASLVLFSIRAATRDSDSRFLKEQWAEFDRVYQNAIEDEQEL